MNNKTQLEKAIEIALNAHAGQTDKAGELYILHPLRLMLKMKTETEKIIAVLHDVIEDSNLTFEDLEKEGFSKEIIESLEYLTKREEEDYLNFINRISSNKTASLIKLADIEDNMNINRIANPIEKDYERIEEKYKPALKILQAKKYNN